MDKLLESNFLTDSDFNLIFPEALLSIGIGKRIPSEEIFNSALKKQIKTGLLKNSSFTFNFRGKEFEVNKIKVKNSEFFFFNSIDSKRTLLIERSENHRNLIHEIIEKIFHTQDYKCFLLGKSKRLLECFDCSGIRIEWRDTELKKGEVLQFEKSKNISKGDFYFLDSDILKSSLKAGGILSVEGTKSLKTGKNDSGIKEFIKKNNVRNFILVSVKTLYKYIGTIIFYNIINTNIFRDRIFSYDFFGKLLLEITSLKSHHSEKEYFISFIKRYTDMA
ncbi:MAG: hypothetical protein PHV06_04215, partial [bacterium]|nr:hypothetical protein [bacterium]